MCSEQPARGFARSDAELQDPPGTAAARIDQFLLQPVEDRDIRPDLLRVRVGIEMKLALDRHPDGALLHRSFPHD
jgi:hypothetical protein